MVILYPSDSTVLQSQILLPSADSLPGGMALSICLFDLKSTYLFKCICWHMPKHYCVQIKLLGLNYLKTFLLHQEAWDYYVFPSLAGSICWHFVHLYFLESAQTLALLYYQYYSFNFHRSATSKFTTLSESLCAHLAMRIIGRIESSLQKGTSKVRKCLLRSYSLYFSICSTF